jgi:hypothetical protein
MTEIPPVNEWDRLVVATGNLTLAAGTLEMAVIKIVCRIVGQTELEIGGRTKWPSSLTNGGATNSTRSLPGQRRKDNRLLHVSRTSARSTGAATV